ncbi:TPA: DNA transfer protein [Escherichia coli]
MATWQQGINSGGFLAGIGTQNENAPKASDINATLGLIRENNELARSGANNVGLTALRGLAGVADIYKQEQQQKAISAFNKVHADAWASGDPSGLFKFAQENPAFVAQAQQAFSGLNEQQRNDMGDLAMRANVALSQGPEAYSKFITDNKDRLNRVGANADWMIQTGIQNPEQLSHMLTTMSLGALGPEKAFAVQDKMVGRQQEQQRINETIRNNDMTNARAIRGQDLSYKAQMARLNHDKYVFKQSQAALERAGQLQDMDVLSLNSQIAATGIDPLTGKAATSARMSQAKRWLDGNNNYNNALITGERGIEKIDSLLGKKELEGIGRFEGRNIYGFGGMFGFPAISDAAAFSMRSTSPSIRESIDFSGCPSFMRIASTSQEVLSPPEARTDRLNSSCNSDGMRNATRLDLLIAKTISVSNIHTVYHCITLLYAQISARK